MKYRLITENDCMILEWKVLPTNILVIHKFCDEKVTDHLKDLVYFITKNWNVTVFLESETVNELKKDAHFSSVLSCRALSQTTTATDHPPTLADPVPCILNTNATGSDHSSVKIYDHRDASAVDLVICLGGDGTFLKIGSMFQQAVPPVLAFRLGTLGFLTPFPFSSFQSCIRRAIEDPSSCLLRTRLRCEIVRGVGGGSNGQEDGSDTCSSRSSSPDKEYHFLNELVIDRGLSPCPCDLLVKVNGKTVTHFIGDGLIVSTPTGSTAYSMATGASLLHPCVPAFLLTPINSLTLSSRAIVLPMTLRLEICINSTARCKLAHFSFDGRSRASNLIRDGDSVLISGSPYPVPCFSSEDQAADWFCGLNGLLNWNTRLKQVGHCSGSLCTDDDT